MLLKNNIILFIKGYVVGIANLIPGVSGGTLAITLGIYERLIEVLSNFTKKVKENILFLIPVILGVGASILSLSGVISYSLEHFLFATIMLFVGAILGGMPMLCKKLQGKKITTSNIISFLIAFLVVILTTIFSGDTSVSFENIGVFGYIKLLLVGTVASATMVVPGVSGSAMLMTIGYYKPIIDVIKSLTDFDVLGHNMQILIPFGVGVIAGIILIAKVINYLLKSHEVTTYYGIIGFVVASVVSIIYQNFFMNGLITVVFAEILVGVLLCGIGFYGAYKLGDK